VAAPRLHAAAGVLGEGQGGGRLGAGTTFAALAEPYAQLNSSDPDVEALQHTQANFRSAVRTLAGNSQ
jgi:hypothetical protein